MNRARFLRAAVAVGVALSVVGCDDPSRTISLNAYRNAVSTGTVDVLDARGISLRAAPACATHGARDAATGGGFAVRCTASTTGGAPVTVAGSVSHVGTPRQSEDYVITVAGRTVVTTTCLGTTCRD